MAQNHSDFMSCVRSLLAEHRSPRSSAANKAISTQSNEAIISVTPNSSADNKSIPPQLKKVGNNKAVVPMSSQSPAANRATPTQTAMTQSSAANISMIPQSPAANRATPTQTAMTQSNTANISMTPQSPAANRATPIQTTMMQSNAADISMTPQSPASNRAISPKLTNVESHAANMSVLSDTDLLAYTTAATVEILRRYVITPLSSAANKAIPTQPATSQSNITSEPQNSERMNVESDPANLSTLTSIELSAYFYVAAIKVLHRSKKALMVAAKEANPTQPTSTLSETSLSGPEMLAWFVKADINVLLKLVMRLKTKFDFAIPSHSLIIQSNLPIAELLDFATAVTVEILQRKAKDQTGTVNLSISASSSTASQNTATVQSNLAYISILSGPELLAYVTAASVEVFQRNVRVLGNKLLLPPLKMAHCSADDVLTLFRPEILTCFTEATMKFLQKSLKDFTASRKRSGETNNGKVKTPRLSQAASDPQVASDPQAASDPQPENQQSTESYPPVYEVLTCSICNIWMAQNQIKICACKVICMSCASPMTKCEDCHVKPEHDIRIINFHQRIAQHIVRPCKYTHDGCVYLVKPGDQHEASCEYEPVECDKCKEYVSKTLMGDHFEEVHFLGAKNVDVKFADFYLDADGSRKIKCVLNQGLNLHISFVNVDGVDQFTVVYPITDLNLCVRLVFSMGAYRYSRTDYKPPISPIGERPSTVIFVDKDIFRDWVSGENKLCIDVVEVPRPKGSLEGAHRQYLKKMERRNAHFFKNA